MTLNTKQDMILSIGSHRLTAKDCLLESFNIEQQNEVEFLELRGGGSVPMQKYSPIRIELTLVTSPIDSKGNPNFIQELWDDNYKPTIRNKLVEDCSIQELLFAVRQKIISQGD